MLALVLTIAMASVFSVTYWLGISALSEAVDAALLEQLELLASRPPDLLPFMITSRMSHQPAVITQVGLFDAARKLIVGDLSELPTALQADGKAAMIDTPADGDNPAGHFHMALRRLPDGRLLAVGRDVTGLLQMRTTLMLMLVISVTLAAAISLAVGMVFGFRTEHRLARLRLAARRIVDGALHERLPESDKKDELDQLTAIVNQILGRLEASVAAWKNVGEDIAHDMRTPLTAVRARLERARGQELLTEASDMAIAQAISGLDEALSVMNALLRIAEIEKGRRREKFAPFDLTAVVTETAETFLPLAEDAGIHLNVAFDGPMTIVGDRALFVEVVVNLVDNAIKFAGRGASVSLTLNGTKLGPVLCVSDTGPGIPPEERTLVFQRFYRSEPSRYTPGSGLGLAVVASIASLHDFRLVLLENAPGCIFQIDCWLQNG